MEERWIERAKFGKEKRSDWKRRKGKGESRGLRSKWRARPVEGVERVVGACDIGKCHWCMFWLFVQRACALCLRPARVEGADYWLQIAQAAAAAAFASAAAACVIIAGCGREKIE